MSARVGGSRGAPDQAGVSHGHRFITRQIEHARQYAARRGWLVHEECIYIGDGISGAEFVKRPGWRRTPGRSKPTSCEQQSLELYSDRIIGCHPT